MYNGTMHCFISDAHIRTEADFRAQWFVAFLRDMMLRIDALYIVGDLFEFWFEYSAVAPKHYVKTLTALSRLVDHGVPIHYIVGNHEVLLGQLLPSVGCTVHRKEAHFDIYGKTVCVAHGHDVDRRLWTTLWQGVLTSPTNHRLYRLIHPDIGVFLAQGIATVSRKQRPDKRLVSMLEKYARSKLGTADIVVLAHSHVPVLKQYPGNKYYLNTGDWIRYFSYGMIDSGTVTLNFYKSRHRLS